MPIHDQSRPRGKSKGLDVPEAIDGELGEEGIAELSPHRIGAGCPAARLRSRARNNPGESMSFTTIAIAGVSAEVGKTTLLCYLSGKCYQSGK